MQASGRFRRKCITDFAPKKRDMQMHKKSLMTPREEIPEQMWTMCGRNNKCSFICRSNIRTLRKICLSEKVCHSVILWDGKMLLLTILKLNPRESPCFWIISVQVPIPLDGGGRGLTNKTLIGESLLRIYVNVTFWEGSNRFQPRVLYLKVHI